jgi:hypothetical protein
MKSESSDRLDRIEAVIAEMAIEEKERRQAAEERSREADKRMESLDRYTRRIGKQVGSIGNNHGHITEEFFYVALAKTLQFAGIQFNKILKNIKSKSVRTEFEFDILLINGTAIALVEVKYHPHLNDLQKLVTDKVEKFRRLFPEYANHKLYLGLAGYTFHDALLLEAKTLGVGTLQRDGKVLECNTENMKAF